MPIRCCYKPGHRVPAEPPGVIGRGRGGDTNLLPCDSGGGRGDAATGVTRRRSRGQSAELLYQGADKPVPEFISHNDQICGGGGAARQRGAATCWNGRDGPSPSPGDAGTGMHGQRTWPGLSTFVSDHPSSLPPALRCSISTISVGHGGKAGMSLPEHQHRQ